MNKFAFLAAGILAILLLPGMTAGQKADSTQVAKADTTYIPEYILQDIYIEAIIVKPSVTFIPKKADIDLGDVPFGMRSFEKELKEKPALLDEYGKDLEETRRIENLKKILAKENK
jgi:hypothetical protein